MNFQQFFDLTKIPNRKHSMKTSKLNGALLGVLLLTAGSPLLAQITETNSFTVNRAVPDGNAAGLTLTGIWEPDGRAVDPANVTEAAARTATLASFNGLGAAGEWTLYLVDVDSGATNFLSGWDLEIAGSVNPVLAWSPASLTYG